MVVEPDNDGRTPLRWAAYRGQHDVIKWWIASGTEMNLGTPGNFETDAIGAAKEENETEVVSLLERFESDAPKRGMRLEWNLVSLMNWPLRCSPWWSLSRTDWKLVDSTPPTARFFRISTQLPLELQMVLCYRAVGSAKENISGKDSEAAFKCLAKRI